MKVYKIHVYSSMDGWRLRIKAPNGRIVADGGEAYASKANAQKAARRLKSAMLEVAQ